MPPVALGPRSWFTDLRYLDAPNLIACGVLESDAGLLLVDPGPATTRAALERALADRGATLADVHAILLTHIHLDHAGVTGSLVAAHPAIQVFVHEAGAPHLVQPDRLLQSARRLYGAMMDRLWGAFLAVPARNVHPLSGGETLSFGERTLAVAYTPGHARHHVSYLDRASGTAFAGDTAGMRIHGTDYVLPVAPPPDIDLPAWRASLDTLRAWNPDRLFLTHFGPVADVEPHLQAMAARLTAWGDAVRASLEAGGDDDAHATRFREAVAREVEAHVPPALVPAYLRFGEPSASWHGLARYWRKHAEGR